MQLSPLLLSNGRLGSVGYAHPGIDLVLDPVVIGRTKEQLSHTIFKLFPTAGIGQAIGEFPEKWFHVRDHAD